MSASDNEQLCADGPAPNSRVPTRLVMLMGIAIGVALGVGGAVALRGVARLPLQMDGAQAVVLDAGQVGESDIVRLAFRHVMIEKVDGQQQPLTIDAEGNCVQQTQGDVMKDSWIVHMIRMGVVGDVTTLGPSVHPDKHLNSDGNTWDIVVNDDNKFYPMTFDGRHLYPVGMPYTLACCDKGKPLEMKHFEKETPAPAECQFRLRPVVGPLDSNGRFKEDHGDDGDDDGDYF